MFEEAMFLLFICCREKKLGSYTKDILRERDHLGDPGIEGTIILRWIFRKWE